MVDQTSNKRIAKNTLFLYMRTLLMMCISLYTSRIVLSAIGVDDFGIYNVVGGVVAMFQILSGSLSSAISRFITFELGKGGISDKSKAESLNRLNVIFSTSVNIQLLMGLVAVIVLEIVGVWFLNTYLNIPNGRMEAANWVMQCSIMTFFVNLISVPYNAMIIAHERMSAFAYISILEAVLKLLVVYLLYISIWDKLSFYACLLLGVSIIIRFTYSIYCSRHFREAKYRFIFDKNLFRNMASFAGWNFFGSVCGTLNTQGLNMLMNIYFGVVANAAQGIAVQVESAVTTFASNFTIALNPQITKNYASGNLTDMVKLVFKGTKFSFFIMYLFVVPIVMETDMLLNIWLHEVPADTVVFVRLTIFAALVNMMANSTVAAVNATGKIKRYSIEVNIVSIFVFPLSLLAYYLGAKAYVAYVVLIFIRLCLHAIRLCNLRRLVKFPVRDFVIKVWGRVVIVAASSFVIPILLYVSMEQNLLSFFVVVLVSVLSTLACIWVFGMNTSERLFVSEQLMKKLSNLSRKNE